MKDAKGLVVKGKMAFKTLGQGKYVLVIILVGVFLLLLPDADKKTVNEEPKKSESEESYSVEDLENKLEDALSRIENAGHVEVILSVESGMKRVYAQDESMEQEGGGVQRNKETVIVSVGSGAEDAVLVQQFYPRFQGALVIASGGNDPAVKLKLTEAVAAITGLGADRISVCKGK